MADVKEVKVTLTEKDAKQFARSTTRKRKMKGGDNTSEIEDFRLNKLNGDEPKKPEPVVVPVVNAPTIVPATSNISSPPVAAPVKIVQEKKADVSSLNAPSAGPLNAPIPKTPLNGGGSVTKIIPKKKHLTKAPTATMIKKPALVIAATANAHPKNIASIPEGGVTRRRRFAERKISVPIRSAAVTRKQTHSLKERIASMPIANVRKMLLRKGLIKASARTPDDMARSLLLEYMLLHRAE